jgi:hypothetical protein
LKPVFLDHAFDAASADGETGLAQFLGDDVDRGIGIEEAMANDLSFDLVGANRVGLGAAFLGLEGHGPLFLKEPKQLIISLSGEAVFLGRSGSPETFALAFEKHEQTRSNFVVGWDEDLSCESDDAAIRGFESHDHALDPGTVGVVAEPSVGDRG